MNGNRRYWKSYAKEFLQGKWGIAVIGMMAAPLMNTIGMADRKSTRLNSSHLA